MRWPIWALVGTSLLAAASYGISSLVLVVRPEAVCLGSQQPSTGLAEGLLEKYDAIQAQIDNELAPFAGGIRRAALEEGYKLCRNNTYANRLSCARVLIKDNRLYLKVTDPDYDKIIDHEGDNKLHKVYFMLLKMLCRFKLPDLELLLNFEEHPLVPKEGSTMERPLQVLPVFSWVKTRFHSDILYPYYAFFANLPSTSNLSYYPWDIEQFRGRQAKAVWRGATTGVDYINDFATWNTSTRARLVAKCKERPDLCDAELSAIVQAEPNVAKLINETYGVDAMPFNEMREKYKYLIVVGGNRNFTASRSHQALGTDMVPLWAFTEHIEFFFCLMQPYEHYVPISHLWEDLFNKIEWARAHPSQVEQIMRAGQHFAARHFNSEFVSSYIYRVFSQYAKLQKFVPEITPKHIPVKLNPAIGDQAKLESLAGGCPYWSND